MRYLLLAFALGLGGAAVVQQTAASEPNACGGVQQLEHAPGGPCEVSKGYCTRAGAYQCVSKDATACITGADFTEICDGLDNDCNGLVDDHIACCGHKACAQSGPPPRHWESEPRKTLRSW